MSLQTDVLDGLPEWQQILIILAVAVITAKAIRTLISMWLSRSERLTRTKLDRMIIQELDYPIYLSLILGGVYLTVPMLVPEDVAFFVVGAMLTAILVVWTRAGIRIGSRTVAILEESSYEVEFAPVMKNLWTFFLVLFAFFLLLSIWEIDITPLLASAGVLGIVLGIAARDSIGNLFGGISLHLDKTFEMGDMIQLDDGTRGTVTDLSIRSTTLLTRDNIAVTIPNAELNRTRVINESAPIRRRRFRLDVGVAYGSDLEVVEEILLREAEAESVVLEHPEPKVRFRSFDDSAILAQLQAFIDHPALLDRARHRMIHRISDAFAEEEIKIPFPQRELTFFEAGNEIRLANDSLPAEPPAESDEP